MRRRDFIKGIVGSAGAWPIASRAQQPVRARRIGFILGYAYGRDRVDPFWRAATYVDRILKGEKPADLRVQAPTKYELVVNLKTAPLRMRST
jgi:hypothetical protein